MGTSFETAMKNVRSLVGQPCEIDNKGETLGLSGEVWNVRVFNWRKCGFADEFIDAYADYFEEAGWLGEEQEWTNKRQIPFAFIGAEGGFENQYPHQICGAILFFDLENGDEDTCPVLVAHTDDWDLTEAFPSIAAAGIRLRATP